jgi:hypothetical protein
VTAAPVKPAPLMVMTVPPAIGPCAGETPLIRGGCCASAAAQVKAARSEARNAGV